MRSAPCPALWLSLLLPLLSACGSAPVKVQDSPPPKAVTEIVCDENPFGDAIKEKDFDKEYHRARMAFMFGKYDFAYGIWKDQAVKGHADSQTSLGWMFQSGKGVEQDRAQAFEWYSKAADQNQPVAQNNLGVLYEQGWGVKKDLKQAAHWYREAAEWGYSYGQYNYALALLNGRGVKRDKTEAAYWLELAALQGVKDAREQLAELHNPGNRVSLIPETPPSGDEAVSLRREGWVRKQNPRRYTIQLVTSNSEQSLLQYVFHNRIPGRLAYIQTAPDKFLLLLGSYEDYQQAKAAVKELPEKVLKDKPFIRRFAKIQELLEPPVAESDAAAPAPAR